MEKKTLRKLTLTHTKYTKKYWIVDIITFIRIDFFFFF